MIDRVAVNAPPVIGESGTGDAIAPFALESGAPGTGTGNGGTVACPSVETRQSSSDPRRSEVGHDHGMTLASRTLIAAVSGLALAGSALQVPSAAGSTAPAASQAAERAAGPRYHATIRTTEPDDVKAACRNHGGDFEWLLFDNDTQPQSAFVQFKNGDVEAILDTLGGGVKVYRYFDFDEMKPDPL